MSGSTHSRIADKVIAATNLADMDREITLYELAAMTRAGPAASLGLGKDYGGLKPGMNADIAIYNINPDKIPSDPEEIEKAFSGVAYLFKDGKICVKDGKVVDNGQQTDLLGGCKGQGEQAGCARCEREIPQVLQCEREQLPGSRRVMHRIRT